MSVQPAASSRFAINLLQRTTDGGLVVRILALEVVLEKPFFSWDHNHRYEADSWDERCKQSQVIQPNGQSDHEHDERQIDGIATKTVGTGSHDTSSAVGSPYGSASCAKFSE